MTILFNEILDQPRALRALADAVLADGSLPGFDRQPARKPDRILLTGMGASYHVAAITALHFNALGVPAQAVESTDLIHYGTGLPGPEPLIFYLSQSGASGEIAPLFERLAGRARVIAVTNHPDSELGSRADVALPVRAGAETLVATKTYLNTLALLWLAARRHAGVWTGTEIDAIHTTADRVENLLASANETAHFLLDTFDPRAPLLFLGHGPHAFTARHAAMVMSEWAKVPALHFGIGAFRHGYIEAAQEGFGVVVFASPGPGAESAHTLAHELEGYGARVLLVENGHLRATGDPADPWHTDEFLSPLLDILPVQLYTEALAREKGFDGFRYIHKVVKAL